jgi:hypothetical protein
LYALISAHRNQKKVVKMRVLKQKKAADFKLLIAALLMVIVLFVAIYLVILYLHKGAEPASMITDCGGLLDENNCCDCYFEGSCPGGETGALNEGCPKGTCTAENFADKAGKAYEAYEREKDAHEEEYGRLGESVRRNLMAKHFGRCCSEIECPAGAG